MLNFIYDFRKIYKNKVLNEKKEKYLKRMLRYYFGVWVTE